MKFFPFLAATVLFLSSNSLSGGVSAAVLGKSDVAEALFIALAENEEIELYEREEIGNVMKELSLAEMNARDLSRRFPHVEYFAVAGEKELIIFDARRGIRIFETQLADGTAEAVSLASEALKLWLGNIKGKASEKLNGFGIVESATNGVPRKYRGETRQFQRELLKRLAAAGTTAILERSCLGEVSRERELSDLFFPLIPSTHLLRLEYTPGAESIIVDCTVREIDGEGNLLASCEVRDILRDRETALAELSTFLLSLPSSPDVGQSVSPNAGELIEYTPLRINGAEIRNLLGATVAEEDFPLFAVPPEELTLMLPAEEVNRRNEAERFFSQADLDSALALDPENPLYRWTQVQGMLGFLHHPQVMRANCTVFAERIKTMAESSGDDPKYLRANYQFITVPHGKLPDYLQSETRRQTEITGETTREETVKFRNAAHTIRESMKLVFARELAKPPTTKEGLERRLEALAFLYANPDLYYDQEEIRMEGAEGVARILELLESVPDELFHELFSPNPWYRVRQNTQLTFLEGVAPQSLFANIDKAETSRLPEVQAMAVYWKFLQQLQAAPPTAETEFQNRAEAFFSELSAIAGAEKTRALQGYILWDDARDGLGRTVPATSEFSFDSPVAESLFQDAAQKVLSSASLQ